MIDLRSVRELAGELVHGVLALFRREPVEQPTTVDELQQRRDERNGDLW